MSDLVIRNCSLLVVPETGECAVNDHQDIHVTGGQIAAITDTRAELDADPPSHERSDIPAQVIDASGLIAVPGLTNSHTHSPMVLMRGAAEDVSVENWFNQRVWPMEMNLTPERVRIGARLACAEMLLAGVTSFVDHYFHSDQIAAAALETGIRADLAPTFFSSEGERGREAAFDAARAIKELDSPLITASLGPHSSYTVTEADLRTTARTALAEGFRVHLHAAENRDQTLASQARVQVTPIEVLERTGILDAGVLVAHGCGILDEDLAILARFADRAAVACCPKVYLKHALSPTTPVRGLLAAGIAVGAGTDGAAGHNTLDIWESLRLIALVQKQQERDAEWMSLSQTLRLATRGGAAAAGLGGTTGALEVGRRADIVLVDLNGPHCQPLHDPRAALVYSVRASDVITVLVEGRVVVRDRVLTTFDVDQILRDVRNLAPQLVRITKDQAVQHYAP